MSSNPASKAGASCQFQKAIRARPPARQTADDYWNLPDGVRAELVDGKLHEVASPNYSHQMIAFGIACALRGHVDARGGPCKVVLAPFAVNLFNDRTTYLEPDVSVICDPFLSTFGTTRWRCASSDLL